MGMTDPREIQQTWGSHQPLLKAIVEVLKPLSVVECGCGDFSTPILQAVPTLLSIEHDKGWASKVAATHPSSLPKHHWLIHPFSRVKNPTRAKELSVGDRQAIRAFYRETGETLPALDFLFVDTFTACRIPAVLELGVKAGLILLHDMEPPGPEVYQWRDLYSFLDSWHIYIHRPVTPPGMRPAPWTGLCSRMALDLPSLNTVVVRESQQLWGLGSCVVGCSLSDLLEGTDD